MPPTAIVPTPTVETHVSGASVVVPDDASGLFSPRFADRALVALASAGLPWISAAQTLDTLDLPGIGTREGVVCHVEVGPGVIAVRRRDYARAERAVERLREAEWLIRDLVARGLDTIGPVCDRDLCGHVSCRVIRKAPPRRRGRVTSWSAKSRSRMVRTLAGLDYAPLLAAGAPAMVTLTYPGDWLTVAPSSAVCVRHLDLLRRRFRRAWGVPLIGVWKREFQRRGAPHYHLLMTPPTGYVNGQNFREWLSSTWASIVDHPDPIERENHRLAGTNVDHREGTRYCDPVRVGVYFSKHGSFGAKEYQNEAPAEWLADEDEGIGRFWGVWGLEKSLVVREVDADAAEQLLRTLRRWHESKRRTVKRARWRKVHTLDHATGEVTGWRWRKRSSTSRLRRLGSRSGYLLANDAPGLLLALAGQWEPPRSSYSEWSRSLT